jgi:hypothetical protein
MLEKVYIVSHRYDLDNLSVCIGSIIYWCPKIKIEIIVNENNGKFIFLKPDNTNIYLNHKHSKRIGVFYGSIIPFIEEKGFALILDSDTAILSPLDFLDLNNLTDIKVDLEVQHSKDKVKELYFDVDNLNRRFDFIRDSYFTFNNGIISFNGSKFTVEDFNEHFVDDNFFSLKLKDASGLKCYDQSLINLVVNYKLYKQELKVTRDNIMIYPPESDLSDAFLMSNIQQKIPYEKVIHWADTKSHQPRPYKEVTKFYSDIYKSRLSFIDRVLFKWLLQYLTIEKWLKNLLSHG